MANRPTLKEVKAILKNKGLKPIDYQHLTYEQLYRLAGYK